MSLEHVRIKEEVEWPVEGFSGFEEVTVPMYEGLQPKMEVELDLKASKREKDCDAPDASLSSKSEVVEDNLDNDFDNLSQVHVKDEAGSEMGVSEEAALAGLYNGCLVKEEMVIGPELVQHRDEAGSEMGVSEAAALAGLYNGCLVKEEMVIGPELLQYRAPDASLSSKSEVVEDNLDNDFDNLSQVHVKDEAGSEMGVSEEAALAGLYNGCLVKEEMVIGPELVQHRDEAGSEMGVSEAAALAGLYNGCLVKEEMVIGPELLQYRDSYSQAASNFKQETPDFDEPFSCKTCLIKAKHRNQTNIQHKRTHMGSTFDCQTCQFINEKYLDFHIKEHTGERPYVCEVCDKRFAKRSDLVEHRHETSLHGPFSCPTCNEKFWRRAYLNEHKKIHTNDLLFKCDVCVKQFNEESDFITHKLTNTDVTPFSCEFCSKQFKHKQLLVSHTNSHAKETVSCDTCSKEFANKEKFLEHIFIRDELTCDVCFKRFRLKYQLARHKRLHTASR